MYVRAGGLPRGTVCVFAHSVLSIVHAFSKELLDLIKVDGDVFGSRIRNFDVWEDGDQRVISTCGEEGGCRRGGMRIIVMGNSASGNSFDPLSCC